MQLARLIALFDVLRGIERSDVHLLIVRIYLEAIDSGVSRTDLRWSNFICLFCRSLRLLGNDYIDHAALVFVFRRVNDLTTAQIAILRLEKARDGV